MAIKGRAWKITREKNAPECIYRLQVTGIKGAREENRVIKAMDGWNDAGDGYNSRTGETSLFFRKDFGDVSNFIKWGKGFQDFPLEELDKNGDVKKYVKIGPRNGSQSASGGFGRKCGLCQGYGHNARTCGTQKATKPSAKATRRCSNCNQQGHNSRTCKNAAKQKGCYDCRGSGLNCETCGTLKVKGKRQCSKCKGYGHNKTTCKNDLDAYISDRNRQEPGFKALVKSKYRCRKCQQLGHSLASCSN